MSGNLYCGLMEYSDMSFVLHVLRETDEFYDIGANVGSYTILASGANKCKTICFEPIPSTFVKLKNNINLNNINYLVDARNVGLGDKNKKIQFINNLGTQNRVNIDSKNNISYVDTITLDNNFTPSCSSIVKIDVEGYENNILQGGRNFFLNPNVISLIVELNGSGRLYNIEDEDIHKLILSFGFFPINYEPSTRKLKLLNSYNKNGNTIYVKNIDKIQQRCLKSKSFCIHTVDKLII